MKETVIHYILLMKIEYVTQDVLEDIKIRQYAVPA